MSRVFHRDARVDPPVAVRGEGLYLIDEAGRRYLDASGGAAVSCLGHSHPKVKEAIRRQVDELPYAHTAFFSSAAAEALAEMLVAHAPAGIGRVYFVSGGSEGVEAAIKLARQYFLETGQPQRHRVIARWQSYHGNTLGALAAGGNRWRRAQFEPLLIEVAHISPCYAYRNQRVGESPDQYGRRAADELEAEIRRLGPETVAAFVSETVVGATLGAVPPAPGYYARIREICDRYGVLLILDEVMCGMGRTGSLHACEQEGIAPDLEIIAKGLGAGYQPIGAVLVAGKIHEAIRSGSGFFQHGHTYMAHPTACAGALAVQHVIQEENLLANVRAMGAKLERGLRDRLGSHPHVGDIRGRGLFWGIELVADRATREPFDPALKVHAAVKRKAMARGMLCYPMGGTVDGRRGDHVLLAPPFIVDEPAIRTIAELFGEALAAALAAVPRRDAGRARVVS
ncbi:MAG: aspartate aminotransferase family protein [Betaproteobacteria bacterium]|nr:aspartate aminotransferase family protein [Betaproteobacteria bacterium]